MGVLESYTTPTERTALVVFCTAFSIPVLVGVTGLTYQQIAGLVIVLSLAYLVYRYVIYRGGKYLKTRVAG